MALDLLPVLEELGGLALFLAFGGASSADSFFLDLLFLLTGRRCRRKRQRQPVPFQRRQRRKRRVMGSPCRWSLAPPGSS